MYQNILFAVEFTHPEYLAEQNAKQLAEIFHAKLFLIHVVELPPIDIFPEVLKKETLYVEQARRQLAEIGKYLSIPIENQYVEIGNPKIIIQDFIKQHNIDLLIVGHHERQGIYHLIGSIAQALIAHAKCAVLTLPYPGYY